MALQQYKVGSTYYGYDPNTQQGIAFADQPSFNQYFSSFDANAAAPTFDVSKLNATPNQLLSLASTPTPSSATPTTSSTSTRTAIDQNLSKLSSYETNLIGAGSFNQDALQQVYAKRPDLQEVYNPDGTAKNINDPRISGMPTLTDWANRFGVNEEPLLKPSVNQLPTNNAASNLASDQLNTKLREIFMADGQISPEEEAMLSRLSVVTGKELPSIVSARMAADNKNFSQMDDAIKKVESLRNERTSLTAKLLESLNMSEAEKSLSDKLRGQVQSARQTEVNIESKPIAQEFIENQTVTAAKKAAYEQMATAENLQALTQQRLANVEVLKTALQFNSEDIDLTLGIAKEMRNLANEQRDAARQTLADILEFSQGLSWDELDDSTKLSIALSLEGTPFTLGMVQNALGAANREFATANGVTQPFYFAADGRTVINTKTGRAYTNQDDFFADGGARDFSNVETIMASSGKAATADISEYEYAKSQGYTGTFQQWVDRTSKYKPTSGNTSVKAPTQSVINKYDFTSSVSNEDYNNIKSYLDQIKREYDLNNMSPDEKYQLWDAAAQQIQQDFKLDPTDFDAMLWETFVDDGLNKYNQTYRQGKDGSTEINLEDLSNKLEEAIAAAKNNQSAE